MSTLHPQTFNHHTFSNTPTMAQQHHQHNDNNNNNNTNKSPHVLLFPYPSQGHINPIIQFSKRLNSKGVKTTLVTTVYTLNSTHPHPTTIPIEPISNGFDAGGYASADSPETYLNTFKQVGSKSLACLIKKIQSEGTTIDAIVYDSLMTWALDVAMELGIDGGSFLTQSCVVNSIYYHVHKGLIALPLGDHDGACVKVDGFPPVEWWETPWFVQSYEPCGAWSETVFGQFDNIDRARWVFTNSFYQLEKEVIEWMRNMWNLKVIGPTLPSMYLDKRIEDDKDYGFSLYNANHDECMNWLDDKPKESVVYISFGSMIKLGPEQMKEITWALRDSDVNFLWVLRAKEEGKLPNDLFDVVKTGKGLVVQWCRQLDVLAHDSVGCFVTHCGFNSTLEAISLGVPIIGMPQVSDQTTNAKCLDDIWGVGVRVKADENGIVRRENLVSCIKKIMEEERGVVARKYAAKWRDLAKQAVNECGSSDKDIDEFVYELRNTLKTRLATLRDNPTFV